MSVQHICDTVQSYRPHIALWLMLYGMGIGLYQWLIATSYDEFLVDSIIYVPPITTPLGIAYLIGFTQLSAYMAVDTVGNWLSSKPRTEIYVHHGVCGVGLISSFLVGLTWTPLFTFGTLECITVCRFIDDVKHELLFCWARILCTILVRTPVSIGIIVWVWAYAESAGFDFTTPFVWLYIVWGAIGASVLPFDCYLMTFYVKRLLAIRRKRRKLYGEHNL